MPDSPANRKSGTPAEPTLEVLRSAALRYLERFPASSHRLRSLLHRRIARYCYVMNIQDPAPYERILPGLIDALVEAGYLNDTAYAQGLARSLAARGLSERALSARMRARGVAPDDIDAALAGLRVARSGFHELAGALTLARRRKIGPFCDDPARWASPEKAMAVLGRAGFEYDIARKVMQMDRQEADALLAQEE